MRIHFQERPWDLFLSMGYTALVTLVLLALGVGNPLALLLVLFTPGYVVVAALFPRNKGIDGVGRVALSVGLSLAVIPILGLLSGTLLGITLATIVGSIGLLTVFVGLAAIARRMRLPARDRFAVTVYLRAPRWKETSFEDRALVVGLGIGIVIAAILVVYTVHPSSSGDRFTEFYVLGPNGTPEDLPTRLNTSEPGTLHLNIANHEHATVNYTIRVDLVELAIIYNSSSATNMTVEQNRTTRSWLNVTLGPGQEWTEAYTFSIDYSGLWRLEFLLFKNGDFSKDYLRLRLSVMVPAA